jgi:outer membrane murein-binding lipoprotein Lpp
MFKNGSVLLGIIPLTRGVASLTTTILGVDTYSITAVYSGSTIVSGSTSSALSQVVNQATSTVSLTSSQNPSTFGQSVTFTATVAPQSSGTPTGRVIFKNGNATLATVTLAGGVATYNTSSLTSGPHTITAKYNGNKDFSGSSMTLQQTVN